MRRVVVTGMGVVSPIGNNVHDFWDSLVKGKNGIDKITTFDTEEYKAKLAAEVKNFDPRDFMSKSDMLRSDRYVHLGFAAACEAVEESGICNTLPDERIGVYFGTGIGGIQTFSAESRKLVEKGPRKVSPFFIPMLIANMASGMIAIKFNCKGPSMPSVTACASGANAIGEAVRAIRHGYIDAAIAGGSEAAISEEGIAGFINMQALSIAENPDEASLPFDKRRSGFVMGEGGAALVLEEYEHALDRGARIYAEITGYGVTCDAYHITAPREDAEQSSRAISDSLKESGYRNGEKAYVNAHGTGTPLNDISETLAVKKAFGEENAYKNVIISSTKSMTGHLLGAAGAAEAIACIKVLNEGIIPPTINLLEKDLECDLNYTPCVAVEEKVDIAVSNSLGFGGHNACLAFRRV